MQKDKLIFDVVVGYMLKVIKSGNKIIKFKNEFNAIKHGDYGCFINLLQIGIPNNVAVSIDGEIIPTEKQLLTKNCDYLLLILWGPSLNEFYLQCKKEYGAIIDNDLTDEDFEKLSNFEMVLRLFVNNTFIINDRIDLINVINLLCNDIGIPQYEIEIIQKGRKFLNMVKGHKLKFSNYQEGLNYFLRALSILEKHHITFDL